MYRCSCGYETEKGNAYSVHFRHYKGEEHKRLGWISETGEVFPARPRATKTGQAASARVVTEGAVPIAGLGGPRPPLIFELEQERIPLNWRALYEAYRYYDDLKKTSGLDDGFAEALLSCFKDGWRRVRVKTRIENDKVIVEVPSGDHG